MAEYLIQGTTLEAIGDAIRAKEESSASIPVADFSDRINALGAGLNFEVVGATERPTNPKENTIWVNTSPTITSWIFSAAEPAEPAQGMVWITTGTSSTVEFNALKKNALQVYPLSAKQYVSGAWVDVTAMSYQGGEWMEWIITLYSPNGYEGDWLASEYYSVSSAYNKAPTVSFTDNTMEVALSGANTRGSAINNRLINFRNKEKVTLVTSFTGATGSRMGLYVIDEIRAEYTRLAELALDPFSGYQTLELDVSNLGDINGYVTVILYVASGSSVTAKASVKELKVL